MMPEGTEELLSSREMAVRARAASGFAAAAALKRRDAAGRRMELLDAISNFFVEKGRD
jgi:hypothetical protein